MFKLSFELYSSTTLILLIWPFKGPYMHIENVTVSFLSSDHKNDGEIPRFDSKRVLNLIPIPLKTKFILKMNLDFLALIKIKLASTTLSKSRHYEFFHIFEKISKGILPTA